MPLFTQGPQVALSDLTDREVLALAIQAEEEDGRIYREIAERLREHYPASAQVFREMASAESDHRRQLLDLFEERYGDHIPLIRREDVKGFVRRKPVWMQARFDIAAVRHRAETMEAETQRFYREAAARCSDPKVRKLLGDLADVEAGHEAMASQLEARAETRAGEEEKETARRLFVLQVIQPGLAGLMDGSVSTLAPVFAAAFATQNSWDAFLVGLAASLGAGISMGFAEALSDDGSMTGRGRPWIRGLVCGLMTTAGGIGHTLPYLIHDFRLATGLAVAVVLLELWAISWIRARYMDTPFLQAAFQVVVGGLLVFATGILIGSA
ncbi:Rubrerythrin [Methylobacterium sp. 4-46]|uniref:iron exporter MbfA n=1 Tax=unclassified Methylobacterium TaxID=2615210 RepID=UPI000152EA4B|nr:MULTISPECIES: ferritin family protein [Methylobacterium]ACA20120.1 Rubrerythrin [Methylobacterium sp. 4-46]WFT79301.1 ferritin family protein [Methylobacterium nodulans]